MEAQVISLFIVDDDKLLATDLKNYLQNKFGQKLQISIFSDGESCLKKIDKETHIVILDYFLGDENGLDILKAIKIINPKVEVIMLSGNEDMAIAIETFRAGAKDYVKKGVGSWGSITNSVYGIIIKPIRIIVKGFFG
jgi:DNA-binding NtrC family response regulator